MMVKIKTVPAALSTGKSSCSPNNLMRKCHRAMNSFVKISTMCRYSKLRYSVARSCLPFLLFACSVFTCGHEGHGVENFLRFRVQHPEEERFPTSQAATQVTCRGEKKPFQLPGNAADSPHKQTGVLVSDRAEQAVDVELTESESRTLDELERYVESTAIALGGCPSAIVVSRGDRILLEQYSAGHGAKEPLGPVGPESLWPLASATKSYAMALILSLAHDDILELDDPVAKYLPPFGSPGKGPFDRRRATIRHLASHTSGVAFPQEEWDSGHPDLDTVSIETEPGVSFLYSNQGMFVLEKTIEAATGEDFDALLRRRILGPLGLYATRYFYTLPSQLSILPLKPLSQPSPELSYSFVTRGVRPSFGLYATAREFNRFGRLWLKDGMFGGRRYFTHDLKMEAWKYHATRKMDQGRYGLLWWLFEEDGGYVMSGAGAKATAVVPSTGVVVTVLRLPLRPRPGPFRFVDDKRTLVQFGKRLGTR